MMKKLPAYSLILIGLSLFVACSKHTEPKTAPANPSSQALYFPPVSGTTWQTTSADSLGWDQTQLNALYPYLESVGTKAFIILKNGKIVTEKYFGTFTT